ncbi:hypothetical protein M3221_07265 [Domibacillus indicus]|uniref:hypothetical protein n=1 Tax=Domibacillus indicus TaxID=1437523 RepID=UPI0020426038|nr:hypothetical protein [Domibacillus indicus]MCM3788199.1 hypothetical protein [Domibacillus indicus]
MRNGIYMIDSIEKGQANLLWSEDESIKELVEVEKLGANVKKGDLIKIISLPGGLQIDLLEEETARAIKEQLLKQTEEKE